jgi:L-asparaginase/Glu-tRNA(Gln) amidotransferase subunit D
VASPQGTIYAGFSAGDTSSQSHLAAKEVHNANAILTIANHRNTGETVPAGSSDDFVISSSFHHPQKARILQRLSMTAGWDKTEIAETFDGNLDMP